MKKQVAVVLAKKWPGVEIPIMRTRRDFLNLAVKGSAMSAAAILLSGSALAQGNSSDGRSNEEHEK
jgi:hypothetical protein